MKINNVCCSEDVIDIIRNLNFSVDFTIENDNQEEMDLSLNFDVIENGDCEKYLQGMSSSSVSFINYDSSDRKREDFETVLSKFILDNINDISEDETKINELKDEILEKIIEELDDNLISY